MRLALVALALIPAWVTASSIVSRPLADRAREADRVVVVQVLSTRTELVGGNVRKMLTHTDVLVGDVLKGPKGPNVERITITQLGGRSGPWESHVPGDATFTVGETAVVLLKCSKAMSQCGLLGLSEGKVQLVGNDAFVSDLATGRFTRRPVAELLAELRTATQPPAGTGGVTR